MTLLDIQDLNVRFPTSGGTVHASRDVSFGLEPGEMLGLVGESGCGKSVIGQAILRLLPPGARVSGRVVYDGREITALSEAAVHALRGRAISLIPQNPAGALDPVMSNGAQIAEVFTSLGTSGSSARELSRRLLASVGLEPVDRIARAYPHQLSGGMRQRLTTSIALGGAPKLIIADEPTKGLDYAARETTARLLREALAREETALLLITHDLHLAEAICDRIAVMYAGEVVEIGPTSRLFNAPRHPYTHGLIRAIPRNGLVPLPGQSPSLEAVPEGCAFADRCDVASGRCYDLHPSLDQTGSGGARCHHPLSL
jgi:peptide/nickel transport system ATP-binding protein